MKKRLAGRKYTNRLAWSVWKIAQNNKRRAASGIDKLCRYFFTFNGDGYITTNRRWNPDAVNPSFVVEFYNDTSVNLAVVMWYQGNGFTSSTELGIRTQSGGGIGLYLCGLGYSILDDTLDGLALWRITYEDSTGTVEAYKDDVLVNTKTSVTIGGFRQPTENIMMSELDAGVMANVKFWINGSTKLTADLVLDMPINDNSNTIKDYSPLALDGVLTAGTGTWDEVCEGDLTFNGQPLTFNGENLT